MAYRLKQSESVMEGVRRIGEEQIAEAIDELRDECIDRHQAVHQVRKRFKKMRGLLRLVRPGIGGLYDRENGWFRDAGRDLSRVRDVESMSQAVGRLRDPRRPEHEDSALAVAEGLLREQRDRIADDWGDLNGQLKELAERLDCKQGELSDWSIDGNADRVVLQGIARSYQQGRKTLRKALSNPTDECLHDWRKRCKDHWYQMRLLRNVWRESLETRIRLCSHLCDLLGDDQDMAVLTVWLHGHREEFDHQEHVQTLLDIMERKRKTLQDEAFPLGLRLYAEKTSCFQHRFKTYWKIWCP